MKRHVAAVVLVLASCTMNQEELTAAQMILDRQLAEAQARADNLNELRREVEALEAEVNALAMTPEAQAMLKAAHANAHPSLKRVPLILPTLPPEGAFEGEGGMRRRRIIADTEARIGMLEKVLQQVDRLNARRDQAKADLALLKP